MDNNMIQSYPLQWPTGYERTKVPQNARFKKPYDSAVKSLLTEVKLLKGSNVIISTNVPLNKSGAPYGDYRSNVQDTGVPVYFTFENEQRVLCCDYWRTIADNIIAIGNTINSLRSIDRWKCSMILKNAFTGLRALPKRAGVSNCWAVLDIEPTGDIAAIDAAYKRRAMVVHPNNGGSTSDWLELQAAYAEAKKGVVK